MWWCLHGALGSFRDWEGLALPQCQAVNLWRSPACGDLFEWARWWAAEVAARDPHPSLLGYSMGGRLALHALLEDPSPWECAVIVSAHPGLKDAEERRKRLAAWLSRFQNEPFQTVLRDWNWSTTIKTPHLVTTIIPHPSGALYF